MDYQFASGVGRGGYAPKKERTNTAVAGLDWHSFMQEQKFENDFSRDLIARRNTYHLSWFLFESDFAQHKLGLLDEEVWSAKKRPYSHSIITATSDRFTRPGEAGCQTTSPR